MPAGLVTVVYQGPFAGELPDGRTLSPGDTVEITAAQAESGWFRPVSPPAAGKPGVTVTKDED